MLQIPALVWYRLKQHIVGETKSYTSFNSLNRFLSLLPHYCLLLVVLHWHLSSSTSWFTNVAEHLFVIKLTTATVNKKAEEHFTSANPDMRCGDICCTMGRNGWNSKTDTNLNLNRCRDIGKYATIQRSFTLPFLSIECLTPITLVTIYNLLEMTQLHISFNETSFDKKNGYHME